MYTSLYGRSSPPPQLNTSAAYYKMKLQIHNFTIFNIVTHRSSNFVWDESEGELNASIFTTIVTKYVLSLLNELPRPDTIIIFSDGCGYQNRNAVLSNALLNIAVKHSTTIYQKYLEKGHTQMECDSTHATIERKLKNININLPSQFTDYIAHARKKPFPFEVQLLNYNYFLKLFKI